MSGLVSMYHEAIADAMEDEGVLPAHIRSEPGFRLDTLSRSLSYYRVKGFARFRCGCGRTWTSAHSWCILDLKTQSVIHTFGQTCQSCEREAEPRFDKESMERMAFYAVQRYLVKTGKRVRLVNEPLEAAPQAPDSRGPHDEGRCAMCKALGRSCWKSAEPPPEPPPTDYSSTGTSTAANYNYVRTPAPVPSTSYLYSSPYTTTTPTHSQPAASDQSTCVVL